LRASSLSQRPVLLCILAGIRFDLDIGDDDVRTRARKRQRIGTTEPS
jgi:hypothetical protein